MKMIRYLKYFFYLATNWNISIAWHIIKQEYKGEKKYQIQTTGADELEQLEAKGIDTSNSTIYMPAGYDLLETVFAELKPFHCTHFVDIGCGKGRAMCVAARFGFLKLTGIDFSKDFCTDAVNNLEQVKKDNPFIEYKVINNDAFYFEIPADADCIFLFNPFNEIIMSSVVKNIRQSVKKNQRKVYLVYLNPLHKDLFLKEGYKEIFHVKKMHYLEASILQYG